MNDINITDYIPEENYLSRFLQSNLSFILGPKTLKKGRLILFKRAHFCIHFTILTEKNIREVLEVPLPYKTNVNLNDGIIYYDFRVRTLANNNAETEAALRSIKIKNVSPSQFYDKVLQICVI